MTAKAVIDDALGNIAKLLATGRYTRVYYSATAEGGLSAQSFKDTLNPRVARYIVRGLERDIYWTGTG